MISLFHYIIGENLNIYESSNNSLRNELRQAALPWFKKHNEKMSSTKIQTPNEIFRYSFGEDNDARDKIKEIFKNVNIELLDDEPSIIGRANGGSGTYKSYKIKYKNKIFYVANTKQDKANLKNKELTPDKLNLTKENNIYKSFDILYNTLKPELDKIKDKYPNSNIFELLNELINKIKSGKYETSGSFTNKTIEDFFNDNNEGKLSFKIDSKYIENVLAGDINCIEKDFGEILGPFMFFRLFDDVELIYPSKSNEPLVDYYINGHKISAKQLGGGGKPSGSSIAKTAKENINNIEKNPEDITNETSDLTSKQKKILFNDDEIKFINDVLLTYDSSIFIQQRDLINKFILNNKTIKDKFKIDLSIIENEHDLEKELDKLFSKINIEKYFVNLYEAISYQPTRSSSWNPSLIAKEYTKINSRLKWGILFYPLYKKAVDNIVKEYGNPENDIISSVIQKVTDMKQIYLGIRKKDGLLVDMVSSGVSKWTLTTGGMSTNNIINSKLSIELKH